jgi:glycosyltransferase involved in cell wall biosynthesis
LNSIKVAVIGTVGLPPNYGGFETLVSNLVTNKPKLFSVYCSSVTNSSIIPTWNGVKLHYIPLNANGISSIAYDIISCLHALFSGYRKLLILGVSGAPIILLLRIIPGLKIITNVDGIEWRREKWSFFAKIYLRLSELIAVTFSHHVVSDNKVITEYLKKTYHKHSKTIAYGGNNFSEPLTLFNNNYVLSICRIEPENNVHLILEALSKSKHKIKFVGNWSSSKYGIKLKSFYHNKNGISCLDPIYDKGKIQSLRSCCTMYVHGHKAGGTNPSLVEMMFYGKQIIAYDCSFNRETLGGHGLFFNNSSELLHIIKNVDVACYNSTMVEFAASNYTWELIRKKYYELLEI